MKQKSSNRANILSATEINCQKVFRQSKKEQRKREMELEAWQQKEQTREMKRAFCRSYARHIEEDLIAELERQDKQFSTPKQRERAMRRIVEKRMAQAIYRKQKGWSDESRYTSRSVKIYSNKCVRNICAA